MRTLVSDALGHLSSVTEDPNGSNYLTSYTYNALDDLLTVSQGVQVAEPLPTEQLSRLGSATNPENRRDRVHLRLQRQRAQQAGCARHHFLRL